MESDQAVEGTAILNEWAHNSPAHALAATGEATVRKRYKLEHLPLDCTPVFEIIYPENRIVVDYKGQRELVLLAIFEHNGVEWHPRRVDQIAQACGFRRPKRYDIDLQGEIPFEDNHEGYVARFGNGFRVKIKSPVYLRIHRILNHLSPKGVVELMRGKEYGPTVAQLPKEIAKDFDDVRAHVQGLYNTLFFAAHDRRDILLSELGENSSRKEKAAWIQDNVPNAECGFVFALLDGKDIEDKVWKLVLEKVKDEAGPRPAEVA
jgi:RNA ligase